MRIKIEYKRSDSHRYPCRAIAFYDGEMISVATGETWEQAKHGVVKDAQGVLLKTSGIDAPPQPEEVEL